VDRVAAAGTPEDVASRVQDYIDAGARHIIFAIAGEGRLAMARRLMEEVAPRIDLRNGPRDV
jgi:alkanesulfonate monooxygenase SsuD/methylene tetrahydromethanopterin reductase-like flavin-dependent oxidoreductase (luciferase family)